jgi:hypothetical protein
VEKIGRRMNKNRGPMSKGKDNTCERGAWKEGRHINGVLML